SRPGGPKKDRDQTQERDSALLHDKVLRDFEGKILVVYASPSLPRLCLPLMPCGNAHDTDDEKVRPKYPDRLASAGACLSAIAVQGCGLLHHAAVLLRRRPSAFILTHQGRETQSLHRTTTAPCAVAMHLRGALVLWASVEAYGSPKLSRTNCPLV